MRQKLAATTLLTWASLACGNSAAPSSQPGREQEEFFESKVRPVLAENCYSCHGPEKQKSGLRLDSRAAVLKGSDAQAVVLPGDVDKSPLIKAIKYQGDIHMPPKGKLPDPMIETLSRWIQMGAPWPAEKESAQTKPATTESDIERARKDHWSFRPVSSPAVPPVKDVTWPGTSVDRFILAELEKKSMHPSPRADRRTLIRRATFDLWGLPPTPDEVVAFQKDSSSDAEAFATVVDRLLASPRYGERWGRHWLDVARYADTKGYVFQEERRYPYSYTYRDFVIRAFNEDLPFDQFLKYQLAADLLPTGKDSRPLAALGFLTVGRRFINNINDIIDDRIDVVSRGLMGLTVTCARCHDHKFDPIPTADYYSLYGVFASCSEPGDLPLIGMPEENSAYIAYEKELATRRQALTAYTESRHAELLMGVRSVTGEYLSRTLAPQSAVPQGIDVIFGNSREIRPQIVDRWRNYLKETAAKPHPVFGPWHALAALKSQEFAAKTPMILADLTLRQNKDPNQRVNWLILQRLLEAMPVSMVQVARVYGDVLAEIDRKWLTSWTVSTQPAGGGKAIDKLPDADEEELRQVLYAAGTPTALTTAESPPFFDFAAQNEWGKLRMAVESFQTNSPAAPPRAMVLNDAALVEPHIFVRGNPGNQGKAVPRQFLAVLSAADRKPFAQGSGRLELARAIASKDNPLTARVFVNRVWQHHYGAGLVRTPSDFGTRGEPPTNPELLDHLASQFVENGWSVKKLQRLIMLSSAYQQISDDNEAYHLLDPENRLLYRMNRQRLDFEALRDSLLEVAGRLDLTMGGPSVEIIEPPFTPRRSVYGFIDRQNLPPVFRMFDFASPDTSNAGRHNTTVPQQALFLMNSPFAIDQARHLVNRSEVTSTKSPQDKVARLYQLAFARDPSPIELKVGTQFVETTKDVAGPPPVPVVWRYGYGEYEVTQKKVTSFTAMPAFLNDNYSGKKGLPDPELGYSSLHAKGGHAGDSRHMPIRRWVSPVSGTLRITGKFEHPTRPMKCGNGVQAWAVSSRSGELGHWDALYSKVDAKVDSVTVQKGDTIDFVVDSKGKVDCDAFNWAPVIHLTSLSTQPAPTAQGQVRLAAAALPDAEPPGVTEWDAAAEFTGPSPPPSPINAWEQYAQVLLLTNEFVFVD